MNSSYPFIHGSPEIFPSDVSPEETRLSAIKRVEEETGEFHEDVHPNTVVLRISDFPPNRRATFHSMSFIDARLEKYVFKRTQSRKTDARFSRVIMRYVVEPTEEDASTYTLRADMPLNKLAMCHFSKQSGFGGIHVAKSDTISRLCCVYSGYLDWWNKPFRGLEIKQN